MNVDECCIILAVFGFDPRSQKSLQIKASAQINEVFVQLNFISHTQTCSQQSFTQKH